MNCLKDYEKYAEKHLSKDTWSFYSQGAEREFTMKDNEKAFTRYTLIPRMLRNAPERDFSVTVLGDKISMPIGLAPTAYQKLAHSGGEIAASRAASAAGIVYTLSTVATTSLEDVSNSCPKNTLLWMQLYMAENRNGTLKLIRRAESNGYKALVVTVDTPVVGLQLRILRHNVRLPPHLGVPNLPSFAESPCSQTSHVNFLKTISWEDIAWLKSVTKLPLVLKGILSVEDALLAVKYGAAAVWISNHGGRQLDGAPATIDVLSDISTALSGSGCEIYMDGGIRWGSDILKALALGARAMFIGRPTLWGLCYAGEDGVRSILEILKSELNRAMHLSGCTCINDIGPHLIRRRLTASI